MCHHASIRTLGKSGAAPSNSGRNSQSTANSTRPSEVDLLTCLRRITLTRPSRPGLVRCCLRRLESVSAPRDSRAESV